MECNTGGLKMVELELEKEKKDYTKLILGVSGAMVGIFVLLAVAYMVGGITLPYEPVDYLVFALISFMGPIGFYKSRQAKNIEEIEKRLPDFLRDVAEAGRFGMTLADSIVVASEGRYGKLTPEIKKMAAQISWGVPASEALRLFTKRVKTPMVERMMLIVIKASDAGGAVADVLSMVAHDARENMIKKQQRKIEMSTYLAVIYISFLVYIVTIIILNATFLPKMQEAGQAVAEGAQAAGITNLPTPLEVELIPAIQLVFYLSVIAHGAGDGIMAGVLQTGRISEGMKHASIMLLMGFLMLRVL